MTTGAMPDQPLNKRGLSEAVAAELGCTLNDADRAVDAVLDVITRAVTAGHDVSVTNFGTFRAVDEPERKARNPQTGETVVVPACRRVRFRVAPRLAQIAAAGDPAASRRKRRSR